MKQDLLVSHDKHLLAYNGNSLSGQDAIIDGLDLNADKQEHDQSELTELPSEATSSFHQEISPVESVPSAVPARETIKNNHCDKGTVLSTGSTDTLSDKTPPPMMLRKRKTTSIINNQAKEESHCNKSPNPLEKSESLLCSRPATAPTKKRQLRKMSSVTQKEDPGITCDHSEISGNSPAERSTVDVPELTKDLLVTLNESPEPHQDDQGVPPDEGQTGRTSTLPRVESGKEEAADMYSPPPSPGSANPSVHEDFEVVAPTPNSASDWISQQPSGLQSQFRPKPIRTSFSCCRCELEFRFLGLYLDHLREHAAQAPFICLLCSDTFATAENLSTHISDCHNQPDFLKCSTCGKNFSTLRNLKKHKLLHKGTSSHHCVSCNASFSSRSALKTHLKTHGTRPSVPRPAGLWRDGF
uniref:C2H2-type domain-containing protein n=1 Tax=Mola mola TaxID=94237 RepID=A0A3Q3WZC7_MOLML